ncbi:MAG: hypothetical protein FJ006_11790 [Chloroflexi bacterium]|nr:hypothetical protein [Chloroflexota bacterium]
MDLNDRLQLHFIFDLTSFQLEFRFQISPVCGANKWNPRVDELQRDIGLNCDENLAVTDSDPIPTSISDVPVNSRSPPSHSCSALQVEFSSMMRLNEKITLGGKMIDNKQDETIKDRIIGLLRKRYTRSQLISDFGFAERTVDAAIKEYKEQNGDGVDEAKKSNNSEITGLDLPAKLDIKQTIVPEYLIEHLSFVDGDRRQTFVDALLVYEAARRSVMQDVLILQGLAAAQAQITETQLRVLREAKSESAEVAQAAAEAAAMIVGQQVQEAMHQAATAGSPDPFASMFVQTIQPFFAQAIARLFGMFGGLRQPPGMMPQQPIQPTQGQVQGFMSGAQKINDQEMKEVFGDD